MVAPVVSGIILATSNSGSLNNKNTVRYTWTFSQSERVLLWEWDIGRIIGSDDYQRKYFHRFSAGVLGCEVQAFAFI